jgi:deoxyribonuclease (pyrimidine dimer)
LREILRVVPLAYKAHHRAKQVRIPDKYVLGTGHVTFFYDKLVFITKRIRALSKECKVRKFSGVNSSYYSAIMGTVKLLPRSKRKDYVPDAAACRISRNRIKERIQAKPNFYRYKGKLIN